ncbi:MAG: DUF4433 domain-containing protein [Candidatus Thiosymbion ectosymbiont of Robbea hypermnestra]|nr:DUF4433 domain-containing protein [Candidatus Thiosymbion ectosymbiont of Robbea hypermnestra]
MKRIQMESTGRGITRLCHFTQSRNLAHILGDCKGIFSRNRLTAMGLPHNPTDSDRYDGHGHFVCCSIQYPNPYYFATARGRDHLFKDWVVILIKPEYLWAEGTKFCPLNAATSSGAYIGEGYEAFASLFTVSPPGTRFPRSERHLDCAPTDTQAEVLIPDPISLDSMIAIAVESKEQAAREICRAELQGIAIDQRIIIAPDFYNRTRLSKMIRQGSRINEYIYGNEGRHDR